MEKGGNGKTCGKVARWDIEDEDKREEGRKVEGRNMVRITGRK
jgi:hypothetical protein